MIGIRASRKKRRIQFSAATRPLATALTKIAGEIRHDFERTAETWDNKPEFNIETKSSARRVSVRIWTDDELWNLINCGAKPHRIEPRRAQKLAFRDHYTPKTTPGSIDSRQGGESGGWVSSDGVDHPGFEARRFTCTIKEKWQCEVRDRMQCELKDAVRATCR